MDEKYAVTVEFDTFAKKYEHTNRPTFETYGDITLLIVEDKMRNRTVCFNFSHVQYYTITKE